VGFFGIGKEEIFSGIAGGMRERGEGELSIFLKGNLLCVLGLSTVTTFLCLAKYYIICGLFSVFSFVIEFGIFENL